MEKRAFEPGNYVTTFTGQAGVVVSPGRFRAAQDRLKEGRRPGRYFAPGCCHNPDYRIQIPVVFEDGTYDMMRAMNIRPAKDLAEDRIRRIQLALEVLDDTR